MARGPAGAQHIVQIAQYCGDEVRNQVDGGLAHRPQRTQAQRLGMPRVAWGAVRELHVTPSRLTLLAQVFRRLCGGAQVSSG